MTLLLFMLSKPIIGRMAEERQTSDLLAKLACTLSSAAESMHGVPINGSVIWCRNIGERCMC